MYNNIIINLISFIIVIMVNVNRGFISLFVIVIELIFLVINLENFSSLLDILFI